VMDSLIQRIALAVVFLSVAAAVANAGEAEDQCAKGSGEAALAACTQLIASSVYGGHVLAVFYYDRGLEYKNRGDIDRAISDYNKAIELDPTIGAAFDARGDAYEERGEVERAIKDFDEAVRLNPNDAFAFGHRGIALRQRGDHDRAIADFSEAVRLDPEYAEGFSYRAIENAERGDYDRAIVDFNKAINLDPKLVSARNGRGKVFQSKGDHDRAIADFSAAINLIPKLAPTSNDRPRDEEDYARAITAANVTALNTNAKYAQAFHNRGISYFAEADFGHAVDDFEEAIKLDPKMARDIGYRSRGHAFFLLGNFASASEDMLRVNAVAEDAYAMLWRFLARRRLGEDAVGELAMYAGRLKAKAAIEWPYAVVEFYLSRRTVEELRDIATTPEQKCEAEFYIGEQHVLDGKRDYAKASLQAAAETCPKTFIEHAGAIAEIKRLEADAK
jgi:tetratricopeptide (TPR) repeat protein